MFYCILSRLVVSHPRHEASIRSVSTWSVPIYYYGYIALIAFNKPFLAQPIGNGVTTLGVPLGFGVIVFTIVITGIYVRRANGRYDALTQAILKDAAR
jgi:uncharacterized membrane protein (DUF485 family)